MTLTATRTNNPVNTSFLQDVGTAFPENTRGYATLQQLVGDGFIEFAFEQNTAENVNAAAGISFAVYPHAAKSAIAAINLMTFGFCVRATEDSNRIFVKVLNNFIDTTVVFAPNVRMRVEKIGSTINFYTVVANVATLRLTYNSPVATPLPNVSDFLLISGRNGCRISNVFINGVTQQPPALDLTKNVYIPLNGGLTFNNIQPRLSVLMVAGEGFTWHFPDGTTSQDAAPNKVLPETLFTVLIRLEVPVGVAAIRDLTIPALMRDGRYTPPDLSLLTSLRTLKFITRVAVNSTSERRYIAMVSGIKIPNTVQDVIFEPLSDEDVLNSANDNITRLAPLLLPVDFNFSGFSQLRTLRLGFMQDNPRKYQAGFLAAGRFPNLTNCTSLLTLLIETYTFTAETTAGLPNNQSPHFLNSIPVAFFNSLVNATSIRIIERSNFGYADAFITAVIVGVARAIASRTTPVLTLELRRGGNLQTATGTILNFATNAPAGSSSVQLTSITGLNVGDRLHLEDGALNSLNNTPIIASITGTVSPFTVTFQAGFTLVNSYTAATGRVLNLESGLGSTRRLRLLGHTVTVLPVTI
jgi:hypothetical protein